MCEAITLHDVDCLARCGGSRVVESYVKLSVTPFVVTGFIREGSNP
jgi:hypothetical protein